MSRFPAFFLVTILIFLTVARCAVTVWARSRSSNEPSLGTSDTLNRSGMGPLRDDLPNTRVYAFVCDWVFLNDIPLFWQASA